MKRQKLLKILSIISLCTTINVSMVDAHSGRTDANGGHKDNKNQSGLGSYHYHHGNGPHLHTNGCTYGGGTITSKPTNNTPKQDSEEERRKVEEREKDSARNKGYNEGYNAGCRGYVKEYRYSGNYSIEYEYKYNEGYLKGREKLKIEIEVAKVKGYEIGIAGGTIDSSIYTNEEVKSAYVEEYEKGITEYRKVKIEEYRVLGLEDGKLDKIKLDLENMDEELKSEYEKSYVQGQEILSKTYIEEGYRFAFKTNEYKSPLYNIEKYNNWYKSGYDKGIGHIVLAKELGYNDGYSRNESNVPEELSMAKSIYLESYKEGKAAIDKEDTEFTMTVSSIGVLGWFIRRYLVAKKSIM